MDLDLGGHLRPVRKKMLDMTMKTPSQDLDFFYRTHGHLNVREMSKAEEMVLEQIRENGFALRGKPRRKSGNQTKQSIEQLKS